MFRQIHWHEGLFLQPHHLQRFQKSVLDLTASERRLSGAFPYGVVEMELSESALRRFEVEFTRLHAILPSGLEIRVHIQPSGQQGAESNAELPSLNLKPALAAGAQSLSIKLAVPKWASDKANSVALDRLDTPGKVRYDYFQEDCRDENTGQNSQSILFRRLRARLVLHDEELTDCETLELLRIRSVFLPGTGASLPQKDSDFVPPLFTLGASPQLCQALIDLLHDVANVRDSLGHKIRQAGYAADSLLAGQLIKVMRLKILNAYLGRLGPAIQAVAEAQIQPIFPIFRELNALLGELSAMRLGALETDNQQTTEKYQHDDPWPCFETLIARIRDVLGDDEEDKPLALEFTPLPQAAFALMAQLTEEHIVKPNAWYLGIRTNQDPDKLYSYVQKTDRFRLLPCSMVEQKILVPGIPLVRPRHVPSSLPGFGDIYYFRLDIPNSPPGRWEQITKERRLAISRIENEMREAGVDLRNAQFTLYMTLPPQPR